MSADALSVNSRAFYERSKGKLNVSLVLGAASMMLLGFCSNSAGLAASNTATRLYQEDERKTAGLIRSDDSDKYLKALIAGYGFAAFAFILGFILLLAAAIYASPLMCGTNDEKRMIQKPQEMDSGGVGAYGVGPYNRSNPQQGGA